MKLPKVLKYLSYTSPFSFDLCHFTHHFVSLSIFQAANLIQSKSTHLSWFDYKKSITGASLSDNIFAFVEEILKKKNQVNKL